MLALSPSCIRRSPSQGDVKGASATPQRMADSGTVEFDVELDPQHLQKLSATAPITGIIELIWNALDADATDVAVKLIRNDLDGVTEIRVIDSGHGMTEAEAVEGFKRLGGSWKRSVAESRGGRSLHGRDGRGRFLAAGLGSRIRWRTVAADPEDATRRLSLDLEMTLSNLAHVESTEPKPTNEPTGTEVLIDGFLKDPIGLGGETPIEKLVSKFGLYLQTNNAHLTFDGDEIDPEKLQAHRAEFKIATPGDDALLVVIEWTRPVDRALYLCDENGTPLGEVLPGIQAPGFEFTAYLHWTGFAADDALALADLGGGETKEVIESARDRLREHFRQRADDETREQIERWKAEKTYPFEGAAVDRADQAKRDVFDVVALAASHALVASDKPGRRLSMRLLLEALENDPGSLRKVLGEVLELKQDRLDELSALLDRTPLTAMIATSKEIADRLEFLKGLEQLVLGDDAKHVKERSQLHRILAGETWVFGEEYALAADDNSLTMVLQKHLSILGRGDLAADVSHEVLDAEGSRGIVDLMLARSLSQQRNRREHLVIELKRPSVIVGDEEAQQLKKYADAVASDPRFNTKDVQWDFYIVSGKVKGMTDRERLDTKTAYGQISEAGAIRIWALTWADVLDNADHRLKFVKGLLEYQPDAEQALTYLRQTHDKYLPPQILKERADTAAAAAVESPQHRGTAGTKSTAESDGAQ